MIDFNRRILMTCFGVVAQATLPMLLKHLRVPPRQITAVDFAHREDALRPWIDQGLRFVRKRVTRLNLPRLLSKHVGRGGLIIDLAWSIDFFEILDCGACWVRALRTTLTITASMTCLLAQMGVYYAPCETET